MAATSTGTALTTAHATEQNRLGALVAYATARLWLKTVDPLNLAASSAKLIELLVPLIENRRTKSARLARTYYEAYRRAEVKGGDGFALPPLTELNVEALRTSLRVTGEIAALKRIAALPPDPSTGRVNETLMKQAILDSAVTISGSAMRHTLNGARDEIQSALAEDAVALGYVRTTAGDPCFFCAMLASRGPVYGDDSFDESDPRFIGEGSHKVHDHCRCGVEPVYDRKAAWPGRAKEFSGMWVDLSQNLGRAPTIQDWRRQYEGRT
jgi:hypothetical protein